MEDVKIKLASLWIFEAVAMSAFFTLTLMLPGVIEEVIAGEILMDPINETMLLIFALLWIIPLIMAFLSLILKDSINRWVNIIVGLGWIIIGIMNTLKTGYTFIAIHLIDASLYMITILIFWYAWKLKD